MIGGSSALRLGDPRRARGFFEAARDAGYPADDYARDNALYLARAAEAHLALGEIEEACGVARRALQRGKEMDSARHSGSLTDLRESRETGHRDSRIAKEFLDRTAA